MSSTIKSDASKPIELLRPTTTDRIVIDRMHSNVVIHASTVSLLDLNEAEILAWIKSFIENLEHSNLQIQPAGEVV